MHALKGGRGGETERRNENGEILVRLWHYQKGKGQKKGTLAPLKSSCGGGGGGGGGETKRKSLEKVVW